jgi:hypothetical protein
MKHEYVLHRRLCHGSRRDQDAEKKAEDDKPHMGREPVGAIT